MNINETVQLLQALKQAGATHFKSDDLEVSFSTTSLIRGGLEVVPALPHKQDDASSTLAPVTISEPNRPSMTPEQEAQIIEANQKIKEMIDTANLSPEELAKRMFPDLDN